MCGFNRCCQRPIVVCCVVSPPPLPTSPWPPVAEMGMPPAPALEGAPNSIWGANPGVECVMEPAIVCPPNVFHHHNRIKHFVPCLKTNIHHVHNHHEYIPFAESEIDEVINHTHGVRPSDQQLCNQLR